MSTQRIFMVEVSSKWYGYTKEMLATLTPVEDSLTDDGHQSFSKGEQTISGKWHSIIIKDEWLDGDHQWVEQKITDKKPPFYRDSNRWDSAVTERAVSSWTLTECNKSFTPTEVGIGTMSIKLASLIKAIVVAEVYGDKDDPLSAMVSLEN